VARLRFRLPQLPVDGVERLGERAKARGWLGGGHLKPPRQGLEPLIEAFPGVLSGDFQLAGGNQNQGCSR